MTRPLDLPLLLEFTTNQKASDLHVSAGAPVMIRKDGVMRRVEVSDREGQLRLSEASAQQLIFDLLTDQQKKELETDRELDFALTMGESSRFRVNAFYQNRGVGAVFRVIPTEVPTFEELGLPDSVRRLTMLEKGLVLVTGPTGSGKSTTLAAVIDTINRTRRAHILTIEDPIEFVHQPIKCMVNQREVGPQTQSFAKALRAALREDPDVILVGELRDLETIALAITAAETGHLVFATLHTNSASKTVDRIINVFPAEEQAQIRSIFAESIAAVCSQILLPKVGGGRVAAIEMLVGTSAVRSLIREGKTPQILSAIQTGKRYGMCSFEQALTALVLEGKADAKEANRYLQALAASRGGSVDTPPAEGPIAAPAPAPGKSRGGPALDFESYRAVRQAGYERGQEINARKARTRRDSQ